MAWRQLDNGLVLAHGTAPNVRAPLTPEARRAITNARPAPTAWEALGLRRAGTALNAAQEDRLQIAETPEACGLLAVDITNELLRQGVYTYDVHHHHRTSAVQHVSIGLPCGRVGVFNITAIRDGLPPVHEWRRALPKAMVDVMDANDAIQIGEYGPYYAQLHQLDTFSLGLEVMALPNTSPWHFDPNVPLDTLEEVVGALQGCSIELRPAPEDDRARLFRERYDHARGHPQHHDEHFVTDWGQSLRGDNVRARVQRRYLYARSQAAFSALFALSNHYVLQGDMGYESDSHAVIAYRAASRLVQERCVRKHVHVPAVAAAFLAVPQPHRVFIEQSLPIDLRRAPAWHPECDHCGIIQCRHLPFQGERRAHQTRGCPHRRRRLAAVANGARHPDEIDCGYEFCDPEQGPHFASGCRGARMICPICGMRGHYFGACGKYTEAELMAIHAVVHPLLHPHFRSSPAWECSSRRRAARHRLQYVTGRLHGFWIEPELALIAEELLTPEDVDDLLNVRLHSSYEDTVRHFGGH